MLFIVPMMKRIFDCVGTWCSNNFFRTYFLFYLFFQREIESILEHLAMSRLIALRDLDAPCELLSDYHTLVVVN